MINPRVETSRKGIHILLSLVAAGVVWLLPPLEAAVVLATATLAALTVELARRTSRSFAASFENRLGPLLRPRERHRLTGATTLALGYTLAALLFAGTAALAGILVAGLADAVAAVVGKKYGRIRYPGGKSVEGSVAFFIVTFAVLALLGDLERAALVALLLTGLEAPTLSISDNLFLPPVTAALVHVAYGLPALTFFS